MAERELGRDRWVVILGGTARHAEGPASLVALATDFSAPDHSVAGRIGAVLQW